MIFQIVFTESAQAELTALALADPHKHRKVLKTLGLMETNLRSPSLQTHEFHSLHGPDREKVRFLSG